MANDVYVKFGKSADGETGGPLDTDLPGIEGDSTDAQHWYWCELRECGFDMEAPQQEDEQNQSDANKPNTGFKPVTLRKRVDWASTQLFLQCCQAAMAKINKATDGDGTIDEVTVEVCRPAGGEKVASVRVIYYNVRIIRYAISISEPEPAENITFEFDTLKFIYFPTDPHTGELTNTMLETLELENHHPHPDASNSQSSSGDGAGSVAASSGGGAPAAAAVASATVSSPGSGGAPAQPPGSAPDPTVNVNFPGLWQGTGFGILPD